MESQYDSSIDIIASAPASLLDSRTYYYQHYPGEEIIYSHNNFLRTIQLGRINTPTPTYVAGFGESMLITWVGLDCTVQRRIATSYTINLKVVDGINPYENSHTNVFSYVKVPLPVNRYEPAYIHWFVTSDGVDTRQDVHIRVHTGCNIELLAFFSTWHDCCSLLNTKVVVKVQHPSRVGVHDHPSWDTGHSFDRTFNKKIKAFKAFEHYVLKGDNALYY